MRAAALRLVEVLVEAQAWEQLAFPTWWLGPAGASPARHRRAGGRGRRRQPPRQLRFRWPRKCSALPRARTLSGKRLTPAERRDAQILLFPGWDRERPHTRADCAGQPRPCPWVSCRYNLFLDVGENGTSIKFNFPGREVWEMPAGGSCVLDVADRVAAGDAMSLEEIGVLMNLGIERVRQISSLALQGARVKVMWEERLHKVRLPDGRSVG